MDRREAACCGSLVFSQAWSMRYARGLGDVMGDPEKSYSSLQSLQSPPATCSVHDLDILLGEFVQLVVLLFCYLATVLLK